jgi:hypothetical protein
MTPDQFRDALTTRRAELDAERETLRLQRDDIETRDALLALRAEELSWALKQFDLAPKPPAQETKPKEKAPPLPSAECAGAIQEWTERESLASFTEAAAFAAFDGKYKNRTLRAALKDLCAKKIIYWRVENDRYYVGNPDETEHRASAQPESDAIRKDEGSPSDSAPESGGAVATSEFPETPAFLRRAPSNKAEAAE